MNRMTFSFLMVLKFSHGWKVKSKNRADPDGSNINGGKK